MAYFHNNSAGSSATIIYVNYVDGGGDNFQGQHNGVSSTTDHGTGDFTVNFSTTFSDTHYAFLDGCSSENTNGNRGHNGCNVKDNSLKATNSCRIVSYYGSTSGSDGSTTSCKTTTMAFIGHQA
tara:strand:- start:345 stop:716 length:372 start_codon:yes stop_codon:yes gene_type:complete